MMESVVIILQVKELKEKIEALKGSDYPAGGQKLIYAGKILADENLISEYAIEESKFIVVMVSKPKVPSAPPPAAVVPATPTPAAAASAPATTETPAAATTEAKSETTSAATPAAAPPATGGGT